MRLLSLSLLLLTGCVSYPLVSWQSGPDSLDGRLVSVSGTLVVATVPSYSHFYLCPEGHSADPDGSCLDVIARSAAGELRRIGPACVTIGGLFRGYQPHIITSGYLRSEVGQIEAHRVAPCSAR